MSTRVEEHFDTESFIVEVEKRGALWNQTDGDYANKIKKKNLWEEILRIFIANFDELTSSQKNEQCKYNYFKSCLAARKLPPHC